MRVFASCDNNYFLEHGEAFYTSAIECKYTPMIEVINPCKDCFYLSQYFDNILFKYLENPTPADLCSQRFHSACSLDLSGGVLIADIDAYFKYLIPTPEEEVGLFFRPECPEHMQVLASLVWLSGSKNSLEFIKEVSKLIHSLPSKWFVDQIALARAANSFYDKINFFEFKQFHTDWEYNESSYIWHGKGPRKHKNLTYLQNKKIYEKYS